MNPSNTRSLRSHRAPVAALALGLALGLSLACGEDPGADGEACDTLCADAGYGSVDESVSEDGTWTCSCAGDGNAIEPTACEEYCAAIGGSAEKATSDAASCTCEDVS